MAKVHSFSVKQDENSSTEHAVKVTVPAFGEATDKQKEAMWDEAIRSVTIKVQGTLRRRLKKGVRGEALSKEAQAAFEAIMNGSRAASGGTVLDAMNLAKAGGIDVTDEKGRKALRAQIDVMTSAGATVVNIPAGV